ncbi:MAG: tyrosine-type recombinase/integrase [Motiliproteus sp.]
MSDTKHLIQRNGLWLFNWRVPKDCTAIFNGKKFITKSLKTHSLKEAQYHRTAMLAEANDAIQKHRQSHGNTTLYREAIKQLITLPEDDLEGAYHSLTGKLDTLLKAGHEPEMPDISEKLFNMSAAERAETLKTERLKAYIEMIPDPMERLNAKALQNAYMGIQHDLAHVSLKDALDLHIRDNGHRLKVNTQTQTKNSVSRFLESVGKDDIALNSIGRRTVKDFIYHQSELRSGATVGNYVSFLSSIWKHAIDLEMVSGANPFHGHKIDTKPTNSYQLFTDNELSAIFKETECFKGTTENYKYLIPRMGYVTGCRIEELCSMTCDQIITDQETGIVYIEVIEGKTDNAKRKIPLHDWVSHYVIAQRNLVGSGLLFPTLTTQRNDGKHGDKVSKWFGRLKKKLGMSERSKSFHSFRVHVATNLERGAVAESTAVWVLGHTRNLSLSYGLYSKGMDLKQLKEAIDVIPVRW